jgi:hypothetical protein
VNPEPIQRFCNRCFSILPILFFCQTCGPQDRLFQAREREPVVIFGDYDVDGVTSAALLSEVLTALGWKVNCYRRIGWTRVMA